MNSYILFLCLILHGQRSSAENEDWIDPFDMFGESDQQIVDRSKNLPCKPVSPTICPSEADILKKCPKVCPENSTDVVDEADPVFLKRFIRYYLSKLSQVGKPNGEQTAKFNVHVVFDQSDWDDISGFLDESNIVSVQAALYKLEKSIKNVSPGDFDDSNGNINWRWNFEEKFHISLDDAIKCAVLLFIFFATMTIQFRSSISWKGLFKRLLIFALMLSLPWTYIHEYQLAVAEHKSQGSNVPKNCLEEQRQLTTMEALSQSFRSMFSTTKNPCTKYHENFLISPILKVPPTKILAVTLSKFILEPLNHVGTSFSITFKNMFSELPIQLWIPAFIFILICMLAVLLFFTVCFGYSWSLNLPFWSGFQIAPSQPQYHPQIEQINDSNRRLQAIENLLQERQPPTLIAPSQPGMVSNLLSAIGYGPTSSHQTPPQNNPQNNDQRGVDDVGGSNNDYQPPPYPPAPPAGVRRRNHIPNEPIPEYRRPNNPRSNQRGPNYPTSNSRQENSPDSQPEPMSYPESNPRPSNFPRSYSGPPNFPGLNTSHPNYPPPHTEPPPYTTELPYPADAPVVSDMAHDDAFASGDHRGLFDPDTHRPCQIDDPNFVEDLSTDENNTNPANMIRREIGFTNAVIHGETNPKSPGPETVATSDRDE